MSVHSQNSEVLQLLKAGPITPMDALTLLGVFRLAARIYDLKQLGWQISTEMRKTNGGARVALYRLDSKTRAK
jgi:hypothetical protein